MEIVVDTNRAVGDVAREQNNVNRYTSLGIASTAVGTFVAVSTLPEDFTSKGALVCPAILMALGLAVAPVMSALRDPKSLLRTEHVVVLAPIYWLLLDLLQGTYSLDGIEPEDVEKALIGIGLFVATVWVGASGRPWRIPRVVLASASQDFSTKTFFGLSIAAFVLGILPYAIPVNFDLSAMIYYLGQDRWAAPWGRGQMGGWDAFLDQLQYFGYLLPTLTVIVADRAGWFRAGTLLCSAMSIIMTLFVMQSGSRRIIGVMFGMAFITWILTHRRLRIGHMLMGAVAAAALLFTLEIMLEYRMRGLASLSESGDDEPIVKSTHIRVDDNFYRLCQTIALIPEYYPHTYHTYFIWVLVRPIPRVFWPGKPLDPGFDLPTAVGIKETSLSSSVIGELYMAGGFVSIAFGGWFSGRLAGMASQLLAQRTTFGALIIYATLSMSLFAGVRSMVELVLMNYATVAWLSIVKLRQLTVSRSSS